MRRAVLVVLLCSLGLLPGVTKADAIQGRTIERALECNGNGNLGPNENGGWWSSVCRPNAVSDVEIPVPIANTTTLQNYDVAFSEQYGSNNAVLPGEFMVVLVKKGVFALDLRGDPEAEVVVTSPVGQTVKEIVPDREYPQSEGTGVLYDLPQNPVELICELGCKLDPAQPVLLEEGYTAILKEGTVCLICLLGETLEMNPGSGVLQVFPLLDSTDADSFSWVENWDETEPSGDGTPVAHAGSASSEQTRFAWAFNPGNSRCGGG